MKILVNRKSAISLHKQIVNEIENRIQTGILKPESRLPSVRQLATQTGVSLMTIVAAYNELEAKGLLEKIHGKGTFVTGGYETSYNSLKEIKSKESNEHQSLSWQDQVEDYISRGSFRHNAHLSIDYSGANLSVAAVGQHLLPTEEIYKRAISDKKFSFEKAGTYPPVEGDNELRGAIKIYLENRNVNATINDILVTSGSQLAISLIAMTFIGQGDVVVVGAPTYPGAIDVFKNRGANVIEVPVDENGMNTDVLLSICETYPVKIVYVMPNYQNPSGVMMNLERKQMLLELAEIHNFMIMEDDSWSEIAYEGTTNPLKSLDQHQRVIYICGFSKMYSPAYRISAVVTHGSLYTRLVSAKSNLDMGAPILMQQFLAQYLNTLEQKKYLLKLNHALKGLRDRTYQLLKEQLPNYVQVNRPSGGLVFWLTFPLDFNCRLFYYKAVMEHHISFLVGEYCYAEKRGSNQLRLCFTFTDEVTLRKSIVTLCNLIDHVYEECRRYQQRPLI